MCKVNKMITDFSSNIAVRCSFFSYFPWSSLFNNVFNNNICIWFLFRSWAKSVRSWSWSWCPACWTELWTPTCCRGKLHLWILRSRWSPVWRSGLSTTGYHCLSATAKPPVKTSSGKLSPPANSAPKKPPGSACLYCYFSPCQLHMNCSRPQLYIYIIYTCQTCSIDGLHWHSVTVWILIIYVYNVCIYVDVSFRVNNKAWI